MPSFHEPVCDRKNILFILLCDDGSSCSVPCIYYYTYRYFPEGAMDIYNCHNIFIAHCTFENNGPVKTFKTDPWRGHAGGLSIAFNYNESLDEIELSTTLVNNTFTNNSARPHFDLQQSTSKLLTKFVFTGRGGGCAVNINSHKSVNVSVKNCFFKKNYASAYGGGLYMAFGKVSGHTIMVRDTQFIENQTPGGAGGWEIGFAQAGMDSIANQVFALGLLFKNNKASYGGGVYIFIAGKDTYRALQCIIYLQG